MESRKIKIYSQNSNMFTPKMLIADFNSAHSLLVSLDSYMIIRVYRDFGTQFPFSSLSMTRAHYFLSPL